MPTIEDLPQDAQERVRDLAERLKDSFGTVVAVAPALSPWVNEHNILLLKAYLRIEHLEHRLDLVEHPVRPRRFAPKRQRMKPPGRARNEIEES